MAHRALVTPLVHKMPLVGGASFAFVIIIIGCSNEAEQGLHVAFCGQQPERGLRGPLIIDNLLRTILCHDLPLQCVLDRINRVFCTVTSRVIAEEPADARRSSGPPAGPADRAAPAEHCVRAQPT